MHPTPLDETPFRVALLGDFSARDSRGLVGTGADIAARQALQVDRDNFDETLARCALELTLRLPGGDRSLSLRFAALDDFHPDRLYETVPAFRALRDIRSRIAEPRPPDTARPGIGGAPTITTGVSTPPNLLDQIVAATAGPEANDAVVFEGDLQDFLNRVVAPHLVREPNAQQQLAIAEIDRACSEWMRRLLHHPGFQSLEALWRAVFLLTSRLETGPDLQLYVIDVSKGDITTDLASDRALEDTGLYRLLVAGPAARREPWSVLVGGYAFGPGPEDLNLVARLGVLARAAGAPWLSAAEPRLVGCDGFDAAPDPDDWATVSNPSWDAIRRTPHASWVGLAAPRFLLRLPYGNAVASCEVFVAFEEMAKPPAHEDYLWGNAAFACAFLLAEAFSASGWALRPGQSFELNGLPLHVRRGNGRVTTQPCAEALLTERAAERLGDLGVMALMSVRDGDAVRLVRWQSIADPPTALAGPWPASGSP